MINANIPNETRKEVYRRDGWQCALCGCHDTLQIHHVVPRGEGGSDFPENLITLCSKCHAQAHGMDAPDPRDFMTGTTFRAKYGRETIEIPFTRLTKPQLLEFGWYCVEEDPRRNLALMQKGCRFFCAPRLEDPLAPDVFTPSDIEQSCVEYLADLYTSVDKNGHLNMWYPYK